MTPASAVLAPKPGTEFRLCGGRLALFRRARGARTYWKEYWLSPFASALLESAHAGALPPDFDQFLALLRAYLPSESRVLDGGCGLGTVVAVLKRAGHECVGIDFVPELIEFARRASPGLDLRVGDVESLDFPDASFDCYVSLGVIEHFIEGPARAIAEGRRILREGGLAVFEVPLLNPARKAELDRLRATPPAGGLEFHQYYFDPTDFTALLRVAGFELLATRPNSEAAVLEREHVLLSPLLRRRFPRSLHRRALRALIPLAPDAVRRRYAHTMLYACRAGTIAR